MDALKAIARKNLKSLEGENINETCPFENEHNRSPQPEYCQIYCGSTQVEEWFLRKRQYTVYGRWICPCHYYPSIMFIQVRFWAWLNS